MRVNSSRRFRSSTVIKFVKSHVSSEFNRLIAQHSEASLIARMQKKPP
jgi:hypothetical protein